MANNEKDGDTFTQKSSELNWDVNWNRLLKHFMNLALKPYEGQMLTFARVRNNQNVSRESSIIRVSEDIADQPHEGPACWVLESLNQLSFAMEMVIRITFLSHGTLSACPANLLLWWWLFMIYCVAHKKRLDIKTLLTRKAYGLVMTFLPK